LFQNAFTNTINDVLDDFKHTDIEVRQDRFSIQFCTGISSRPEKWQENAIPLLTRADKALIQARKDHSSIVFYHKDLPILQEMESNQIMTKKVKRAIQNDQLWVQYQPIYHANNNAISHFECLIRLFDEENKVVPPNEFIHVAQKANLYPEITKKVLTEAVKMIKATAHSFAVNLSAHDFTNADTLNYIDDILADSSIAQHLFFEEELQHKDSWLQLDKANVITLNGLDGYCHPKLVDRFKYARKDQPTASFFK
jgi:predicted signal transduction protein with EAL and GGDEF domain